MKRIACIFILTCCTVGAIWGQTAFSICLDEAKEAYALIDHQKLLKSDSATSIKYALTYIMTKDPEGKKISGRESWLFMRDRSHYITEDMHTFTTSEKSYNYRPHQFVIYLAPGVLGEKAVVREMDPGIWAHATVTYCEFVKEGAYIKDGVTVTPKRMDILIDQDGQEKYHISNISLSLDPVQNTLLQMTLDYVGKTEYKWAEYTFSHIGKATPEEVPTGTLDQMIKTADGSIQPAFSGAKLIDVR